jgi:hypothetical protein
MADLRMCGHVTDRQCRLTFGSSFCLKQQLNHVVFSVYTLTCIWNKRSHCLFDFIALPHSVSRARTLNVHWSMSRVFARLRITDLWIVKMFLGWELLYASFELGPKVYISTKSDKKNRLIKEGFAILSEVFSCKSITVCVTIQT